jgi:hypothetical protein
MIFAILDDRGLVVHNSIDDACRGHEPVDVENGDVHFFDDDGWPLDPVFVVPNHYGKALGVTVVEQGEFRLERRVLGTEADSLKVAIDRVSYLQPNQYFASVDAIRTYVADGRPDNPTS